MSNKKVNKILLRSRILLYTFLPINSFVKVKNFDTQTEIDKEKRWKWKLVYITYYLSK